MFHDTPTTESLPVISVTELTRDIKSLLENRFPSIWVEGEIFDLSCPSSGHVYFKLKDDHAQLFAVIFRSAARRLPLELANGMRVQCAGRITVYEPRGSYQISIERVRLAGEGHLLAAFEALKQRLKTEGLFDEEHKKPLPLFPRRVGVITSGTGAAVRDILRVIHDRFPLPVLVYPCAVQGAEAPRQLVAGVRALDDIDDIDVIILGRGGGSMEDLWAFNHEELVRTISEAKTPIVSGVGHETDSVLTDFVADLRASTPTRAAELVVPKAEEVLQHMSGLQQRLVQSVRRQLLENRGRIENLRLRVVDPTHLLEHRMMRLDEYTSAMEAQMRYRLLQERSRIESMEHKLRMLHPKNRVTLYRERLEKLRQRLCASSREHVGRSRQHLALLEARLSALGPTGILERGYAIVRHGDDGRVVKSTDGVRLGDPLRLTVFDGDINVDVTGVSEQHKPKNTGG